MENGYQINVAVKGTGASYNHFFDIWASSSRYNSEHLAQLLQELYVKFPAPAYDVEVVSVKCTYSILPSGYIPQ